MSKLYSIYANFESDYNTFKSKKFKNIEVYTIEIDKETDKMVYLSNSGDKFSNKRNVSKERDLDKILNDCGNKLILTMDLERIEEFILLMFEHIRSESIKYKEMAMAEIDRCDETLNIVENAIGVKNED